MSRKLTRFIVAFGLVLVVVGSSGADAFLSILVSASIALAIVGC